VLCQSGDAQEKDYEKHQQYLAQMDYTTKPYQTTPRKSQVVTQS